MRDIILPFPHCVCNINMYCSRHTAITRVTSVLTDQIIHYFIDATICLCCTLTYIGHLDHLLALLFYDKRVIILSLCNYSSYLFKIQSICFDQCISSQLNMPR